MKTLSQKVLSLAIIFSILFSMPLLAQKDAGKSNQAPKKEMKEKKDYKEMDKDDEGKEHVKNNKNDQRPDMDRDHDKDRKYGENDNNGKGHAYGKNKGNLSGREFGQQRAEEARQHNQRVKNEYEKTVDDARRKHDEARKRIDDYLFEIEKQRKEKKITEEIYLTKKEKAEMAEKALNELKDRIVKKLI